MGEVLIVAAVLVGVYFLYTRVISPKLAAYLNSRNGF